MPHYGNYVIKDLGGVVVAQSKLFLNFTNIKHYFTTRKITSQEVRSCLSELNMAVSDENFPKNFELFSKVSGIDPNKCVFSHQVHGKNIKVVTSEDIGQPYWNRKLKDVDGLITNEKGLFLVTTYADCMPILAYDPVNIVIGVAHSGWRGTLMEIAKELILKMNTEFGSHPEEILVTVGPSIGPESFEVGKEVATEFFLKFGQQVISEHHDKIYVNLWKAVEITLKSIGVKHMEFSMIDTYKCTELFYSYRKEKTKKRFANIVGIE